MRKFFAVTAVLIMLLVCFFSVCASASDDLTLVINGKTVESDVSPMIINSRTMVPVRILFDTFGADVLWNGALNQAIISTKTTVIVFTIGSKTAYIDGVARPIDVAPVIVDGRTLVPVRFISETLKYDVIWNASTRTVYINNKKPVVESSTGNQTKDEETSNTETSGSEEGNITEDKIILSKISAVEKDETVDITVMISEKTEPKTMKLSSPDRLVFDFYDVVQTAPNSNIEFATSSVLDIRWATHKDFTRIVVETGEPTDFSVRYTSSACIISVEKTDYEREDDSEETEEKPQNTAKPTIIGKAPLIVIDAGHGGYDSGALGYDEDGEVVLKEKDVNLTISRHLQTLLKNAGIKVIMTRSSDVALGDTVMADLVKRAEIANESGADLFISVHNNAFTNPDSTGSSVLYAGLSNEGDYGITSFELAENIMEPLAEASGLRNRGTVESPEMVVLKKTVMPAVLIECGFVTSYNDQKVLSDPDKLEDIAKGIYDGIIVSLQTMGKIK